MMMHSFALFHNQTGRKGVAALPSVLIIGGIIVQIAIVGAFLAYLFASAGYGTRLAGEALNAARAGAQDAMMRVARDKTFSSAGYTVTTNGRAATVVVTRDSPVTGQDTILSTATALTRQKKIEVILEVDATTGQIEILSFGEVAI